VTRLFSHLSFERVEKTLSRVNPASRQMIQAGSSQQADAFLVRGQDDRIYTWPVCDMNVRRCVAELRYLRARCAVHASAAKRTTSHGRLQEKKVYRP
jgi:hypothetical protein